MHDDPTATRRAALGRRIHDRRRARRLSQEALALACGLDRRTVQRIEGGRTDARLSWLLRIADALRVPLAELIGDA